MTNLWHSIGDRDSIAGWDLEGSLSDPVVQDLLAVSPQD